MSSNLNEKYYPIVLCAGFGTRLQPLTHFMPKVVCPLIDKPFAFYSIEKFFKAGFDVVHCNTHYLSKIVEQELKSACEFFGYNSNRIRFWNEESILETGGGIARIVQALALEDNQNKGKDIIAVSGDVVADFPLTEMIHHWETRNENELALMCTKEMKEARKDGTIVTHNFKSILGFGEAFRQLQNPNHIVTRNFSNHQIISGQIVNSCSVEKKSSIDLFYRRILNDNKKIINLNYPENLYWFNIGTPQEYLEAQDYFAKKNNLTDLTQKAFVMPEKLKEMIESQHENFRPNQGVEPKIMISFRDDKRNEGKIFALSEDIFIS